MKCCPKSTDVSKSQIADGDILGELPRQRSRYADSSLVALDSVEKLATSRRLTRSLRVSLIPDVEPEGMEL